MIDTYKDLILDFARVENSPLIHAVKVQPFYIHQLHELVTGTLSDKWLIDNITVEIAKNQLLYKLRDRTILHVYPLGISREDDNIIRENGFCYEIYVIENEHRTIPLKSIPNHEYSGYQYSPYFPC
jgi:hypothetical protein